MKLVRCENGHVYDQDVNSSCPECEQEPTEQINIDQTAPEEITPWQPFEDGYSFDSINIPKEMGNAKIVEMLGQGSTGRVYRIQQTVEYAVKVISWEKRSNRANAQKEYEMAALFRDSPNIVPYLHCYEVDQSTWLVQELCSPWFKWYRNRTCKVADVLHGILDILHAIRDIHKAGLVHFDIKPGNLFVSESGVKLGDFSHACPVKLGENYSGPRGTPLFMAPEIGEKATYNGTEDLYSLGITMYTLFTGGNVPYGKIGQNNRKRQKDDRIQTLFLHPDLIRIIEKATAFYPENRYQTPDEFEDAICDFILVNMSLMAQEIPAYSRMRDIPGVWRESTQPTLGTESAANQSYMENPDFTTIGQPNYMENTECATVPPTDSVSAKVEIQKAGDSAQLKMDAEKTPVTTSAELLSSEKRENPEQKSSLNIDQIRFTAAADHTVNRGDIRLLEIAMYTDAWERKMLDEIRHEIGEDFRSYTSSKFQIEKNKKVTVQLIAPDVRLDEEMDTQVWNGEYLKFVFDYEIPEEYSKNQILFRAKVFFDGIQATTLRLVVPVQSGRTTIQMDRLDIRSAFVSYSREDMKTVTYVIQAIRAARPDLDLFFDLESLRTGEHWKERLLDEILKKDVLFLCWSKSAAKSEWVNMEWQFMADQKGVDAITPIPLDGPDVCPVPERLSGLHFDALEVLIRTAKRFSGAE